MRLQIKRSKDIDCICLVIIFLRVLGVSEQLFFILSSLYLYTLIIKHRKIYLPKVSGLGIYILFIVYAALIGIISYPVRNVIRDLFYILPTVIWIFIGYYISKNSSDNNKILKILYIYGCVNSIFCIINFMLNSTVSFNNLRSIFGANIYDIGFILPIMIYEVLFYKKKIFGRKIDICCIMIMLIQIFMSFGRIAIVEPLIVLFMLFFLELKRGKHNRRVLKMIILIIGTLITLSMVSFYILPNDLVYTFIDKLLNSFQEIQQSKTINTTSQAMNNWRAYEMKAALENWKESNIFIKLLGSGLGAGTKIKYIPYNWYGIVIDNQIPLLHNGFYSLLTKGGILGVLLLLWLFLGNMYKSWRIIGKNKADERSAIILFALCCGGIANTYVVRGPVQQGTFLVWGILLGGMSYTINKKVNN